MFLFFLGEYLCQDPLWSVWRWDEVPWALGGVCFLFNGPSLRGILQVINSAERVSCWVGGAWCGPGPVGVALPPGSCFLGGGLEGVPMGALGCSTSAACLLFICFK